MQTRPNTQRGVISVSVRAVLGGTFAFAERQDDARAVLRELDQAEKVKYVSPIPVATALAALGECEAAFARLEDAPGRGQRERPTSPRVGQAAVFRTFQASGQQLATTVFRVLW